MLKSMFAPTSLTERYWEDDVLDTVIPLARTNCFCVPATERYTVLPVSAPHATDVPPPDTFPYDTVMVLPDTATLVTTFPLPVVLRLRLVRY